MSLGPAEIERLFAVKASRKGAVLVSARGSRGLNQGPARPSRFDKRMLRIFSLSSLVRQWVILGTCRSATCLCSPSRSIVVAVRVSKS